MIFETVHKPYLGTIPKIRFRFFRSQVGLPHTALRGQGDIVSGMKQVVLLLLPNLFLGIQVHIFLGNFLVLKVPFHMYLQICQ
jgi:hypothetical protein